MAPFRQEGTERKGSGKDQKLEFALEGDGAEEERYRGNDSVRAAETSTRVIAAGEGG